jgi:hypothetical protein
MATAARPLSMVLDALRGARMPVEAEVTDW